jgi:hypothetical protein
MRALLESLESRVLFSSLPASFFAGPLIRGATFTFVQFTGGKQTATEVRTVVGPATFNGSAATEISDKVTTSAGSAEIDQFLALSSSKGLLSFGTRTTQTFAGKTTVITRTYSPVDVAAPPSIKPGSTYTVTNQRKDVTTVNGKVTSTVIHTLKEVGKLAAKTTVITTPAGKLTVYEVDITRTNTVNKVATVTTEKDFFAAGVGLVEVINGTGSSQIITELKSYKL